MSDKTSVKFLIVVIYDTNSGILEYTWLKTIYRTVDSVTKASLHDFTQCFCLLYFFFEVVFVYY